MTDVRFDPPATPETPVLPGMPEPPATDEHGNPRGSRYFRVERQVSVVVTVTPADLALALEEVRAGTHGKGFTDADAPHIAAGEVADGIGLELWEVDDEDTAEVSTPRGGLL